jgi:SAM-dependent methyltransferase
MVDLEPAYRHLTFMTPLSQARADRLIGFLASGLDDGVVVDVGCGWAELLLQVLAAVPAARGVGIDLDELAIAHGRDLAAARGLGERVELHATDVSEADLAADALICIGASQIWGPPVDANEPINYASALRHLRAALRRGGRLVYGEGIWSAPPTAAAAAPLSGRLDEFVTLGRLVDLAVAAGFQPVLVTEATTDEWDEFESGYCARYSHRLADQPDDPTAKHLQEEVARQRDGYFNGYRGVLGMAYLGLLAV